MWWNYDLKGGGIVTTSHSSTTTLKSNRIIYSFLRNFVFSPTLTVLTCSGFTKCIPIYFNYFLATLMPTFSISLGMTGRADFLPGRAVSLVLPQLFITLLWNSTPLDREKSKLWKQTSFCSNSDSALYHLGKCFGKLGISSTVSS